MQPFNATVAHLREQFVAGTQQRARRIGDLIARLSETPGDEAALADLLQHSHRLAGAAATYGYPGPASHSRHIERAVRDLVAQQRQPTEAHLNAWRAALAQLRSELGRAHSGALPPTRANTEAPAATALLVMSWGPQRDHLSRALQSQGMRVRTASDRATARRALRKSPPAALIIDLSVQGGTVAQVVGTLGELAGGDQTVVIFVCDDGAYADPLDAVRAGADAVLQGEVLPERVGTKLRELLAQRAEDVGHVLYLEGDPDQAAYVERLLRGAGYEVTVCTNPARFGDTVRAVQPDLILMETVLPGVSGVEVARALRQDPRHRDLPLLFLASDVGSHARAQHDATPLGRAEERARAGDADGWLRKPIDARLLLSTIASHLQRARMRAELRELDGTTNLLHHAAFERRLTQWMTASDPAKVACALVLVDLDATAELNARFGHAVCDELLRGLGDTLSQALRGVHLSGRYDGDAFALLVLQREEAELAEELEALRTRFASEERYAPDGRVFQANISVGVARFQPGWRRSQLWLAATEDAVRAAKKRGGGRVTRAKATSRSALNVARHR